MDPTHSREMPKCSAIDLVDIKSGRLPRLALEFDQYSVGWSLFLVVQDEAYHRWKNHHV